MKQKKRYIAYLLRLWQDSDGNLPHGDSPLWRASLERPQAGDRLGFASLDALFAFLEKETRSNSSGLEHADEEACQTHELPE